MSLLEKIRGFLFGSKKTAKEEKPVQTETSAQRTKKACKNCGKLFPVDPAWTHIPNYCKDCRKKFAEEKEARQRAGAPRRIKRKCRECGNYFTFPNTLAHYPNYCSNCRKRHQAAMKEKYSRKGKAQ